MIVKSLLPANAVRPRWSSASALVYIGALVVLSATGALLGILADLHGEAALAGYSALASAVALGLALVLQRRDRDVAAGVAATLAVIFFAVTVASLLSWIGLLDEGDGYQPAVHIVEAATILAAVVALHRFRAPLLVLVLAVTIFITLVERLSAIPWDDADVAASLVVGALFVAAGIVIDRAGGEPYAFWLHFVGGIAFGGAVLDLVSGDLGWALVGVVSLAYVAAAFWLERAGYAVLGAIGILATTTYFTFDVVGLATSLVPFGEGGGTAADVEPWQVAAWFVVAGLLIGLLGLVGGRLRAPRDGRDDPRRDRDELAPGA